MPTVLPSASPPPTVQGARRTRSVDGRAETLRGMPGQSDFLSAQNSVMLQEILRLKRVNVCCRPISRFRTRSCTRRLYRKGSFLTSPGSGEQAAQARKLEELQAVPSRYDATQQQEAYANEEKKAGRGTPVHPGSVSRTANRPLLTDAMAVKASHDDSMLRPLLSNARTLSSSTASASRSLEISSDQPSARLETSATSPAATSCGNDELSSFLIRSQEKRKRFSSSIQQLMRTTSSADEQSRAVGECAWFEESFDTQSDIAHHESTCRAHLEKRVTLGRCITVPMTIGASASRRAHD